MTFIVPLSNPRTNFIVDDLNTPYSVLTPYPDLTTIYSVLRPHPDLPTIYSVLFVARSNCSVVNVLLYMK